MASTAVIIDDSRTTRACLKVYLAEAGFDVVAEGDRGEHAIQLWERHQPTLLTLDVVLPGMDGVSAAKELLKKYPEATVVMCSSINAREKIVACLAAGVRHYILKPFTREKVQQVASSVTSTP